MIKDRLGARPAVLYLPIGIEGGFKGLVDLVAERRHLARGVARREVRRSGDPGRPVDKAKEYRDRSDRDGRRAGRRCDGGLSRGHEPSEAELKALIRKGTLHSIVRADRLRLGVQEQGRAAAARRGGRLSAVAARHPRVKGVEVETGDDGHARPSDERAAVRRSRSRS